jgi:hypothetical protein
MRLPSICRLGLRINTSRFMRGVKLLETGNKNEQITAYADYYVQAV